MQVAGIIAEYNLLHCGHLYQIQHTREQLGPDGAVICAMSGNFVQRGDFAAVRKHARAEAAVRSGADLVLELPLPWAAASAERFADGGVQTLLATGLVTHLSFGSECGDAALLERAAEILLCAEFPALLKEELARGVSFAAARQRAAERLMPAGAAEILSRPNDLLGVEYCKSLARRGSRVIPMAVRRVGASHDAAEEDGVCASSIRRLLADGKEEAALVRMAPAMAELYLKEKDAGRAPVFADACQRAILARLRSMERAEYRLLDEGNEGLGNRLYAASRSAATLPELLAAAKTKRYAYARLRRMVLWAYLGLTPKNFPKEIPYLRVLAANAAGRGLLAQMRETASVPVLTKPADVRVLGEAARRLFDQEVRATDLYALAWPNLAAAGSEWRDGPAIL